MNKELEVFGYSLLPAAVDERELDALKFELETAPSDYYRGRKNGTGFAIRNVHLLLPKLRLLLEQDPLRSIAAKVLGANVSLVSATLFDKLPGANWFVPPHQDVSIPIQGKTHDPRWSNWTTKGNVNYVEPPTEVHRQLLALRIHLDECAGNNGALEVIPETHCSRLREQEIALIDTHAFQVCAAERGDVLLMKPLLVHRSRTAEVPERRRVLHAVYSSAVLPDGLRWT